MLTSGDWRICKMAKIMFSGGERQIIKGTSLHVTQHYQVIIG